MHAVVDGAELPDVTDDDRGAAIQRRLDELGIRDREFYTKTGIDRKTLRRAIENAPGTRDSTYLAINGALDKLEALIRGVPTSHGGLEFDLVEFTIEGNFGVRAVVKGPVKDMAELQKAVSKLVAEMRGDSTN